MNKLLSIALIGVFAACQQGQKEEKQVAVDPTAITCEGIGLVKLTHTYADLENEIGAEKLENGTREIDGSTLQTTRVYPDEPDEITVYWAENEAPFNTITKLSIGNNFGSYQTADGIRVGSTLEELRKVNNFMPITMTNFYSSLDGFAKIIGFNGGDIATNYPCLGGMLDIVKQKGVDVRVLDEIKNDAELISSHKLFATLDVEVVELSISKQ